MKKFVGYMMIILLFAGSIAGVYFGIQYKISKDELVQYSESIQIIEDLKNKLELSTEREEEITASLVVVTEERDQYKQSVNGLNVQIQAKDEKIAELETKASEDTEKIATLQVEKETLQNSLTESEEDREAKQARIDEIEAQISELEESLKNTQTAKAEVESERDNLITEKTALEGQLLQSNQTIETLQSEKLALQNEVSKLTDLLAEYDEIKNGTFEVDFYIGETHYTTKVVKNGNSVKEIEKPADTNEYRFDGWSLDKINTVDPTTMTITANTTFYALTTPKFAVKFRDGESVETQYVIKNETPNVQTLTKDGYEFLGWSENGVDIVSDISTRPVTAEVEYIAVWVQKLTVQYMDGDTILNTESVMAGNKATFPTAPTKEGWTFDGWYNNGVKVSTSNFKPTESVVLKAQYYKWETVFTGNVNLVNKNSYEINGIKVNDKIRATIHVGMNYYIDNDGNDWRFTETAVVTSDKSYTNNSAGWAGWGSYTLTIACEEDGQMSITKTASTHNTEQMSGQWDEFTFVYLNLQKLELYTTLYEF